MKPVPTVLVTGVGSVTGISVLKALRRQSAVPCRLVGTDSNPENRIAGSAFCDVFYQVPRAGQPGYIKALLAICRKEKVSVLFPIVDPEIEKIAGQVSAFKALGARVWVSGLKTVRVCNDKYQTHQFLKKHSFLTPRSWLPQQIRDTAALPYPLILKPRKGVGSEGVIRVENDIELKSALRRVREPIVQEYLAGEEFTIDTLADNRGRLLAVVPRRRIEIKAGVSYKGVTVKHTALIRAASRIVQALKICGPCNLQCKLTRRGPSFIDINPRFSGALPLTVAAGVNGPLLLVQLSLGMSLKRKYDFQADVYMARYWEETFF